MLNVTKHRAGVGAVCGLRGPAEQQRMRWQLVAAAAERLKLQQFDGSNTAGDG